MFKSASVTQFDNPTFPSTSYTTLGTGFYDSKAPFESRSKKNGVKFGLETDKENTLNKTSNLSSSTYIPVDKLNKTWNQKRVMTETEDEHSKSALKQLMGGCNYQKDPLNPSQSSALYSSSKLSRTENYGFLSKKLIEVGSRKFIQEPEKFQRSFKQCKSMKIIPSYNPDEDSQVFSFKPKKIERKFQKFQAYDELLKSSQNLIQKYKKLQVQKSKLRNDLKTQIENHSKSSKKITFLEQTETNKKHQKSQKTFEKTFQSQISDSKPSNSKDYSLSKKYGNYNKYQTTNYDPKYELKVSKSPSIYSNSKMLNKTFSSMSKPALSTEDSSYLKPQPTPYTCNGNFGLSKSTSSKKIGATGLSLQDFELGKCLGSGAFGQVFPAKHKKTGWLFALKKVPKQKVKYMLDQFITQIKIQLFLDHPNIVKLYSFFDDDLHFYILMQYMQGGSLYSYLKKQKTLTLEQTSKKLRQVCEGLQHMHENQILHRDIKPQNIVMCHNVSKLCDFGWSAICKDRRTTYCGTLDYVSPEIIGGDGYDDSVDIWCVGVLTYELLVGKTPFFNISRKQTMKKIIDCNLQYPSSMPQVAVKFVKNILRKNPEHRQTIEQILKEPLLKISETTNSVF